MKTIKQLKKVYVSEVGNLLITTQELKNGTIYGDELSSVGIESVEWKTDEEKHCVGTAIPVYGVVDKDNEILSEQLPFYFKKDYAVSAAKQMNEHISNKKKKPYKIRKAHIFYPLQMQHE